jgi:hypothetical protein
MAIPYIAYLVFSPLGMGTEAVVFTLYLGLGAFLCSKLE